MAFMLRRCLSTSVRTYRQGTCKYVISIPAPVNDVTALETPELQQLARKSQGSWKELSNEEVVQLYRAQFPYTYKEIIEDRGRDWKTVLPAVILLSAIGIWGSIFLRDAILGTQTQTQGEIGPELPHTYNNPEWEAATREKLLKDRSNPIEGISSGLKN